MNTINLLHRSILKVRLILEMVSGKYYIWFYKNSFNISFSGKVRVFGKPIIRTIGNGKITVGEDVKINSSRFVNIIGRYHRCHFIVKGELILGKNVGISSSTIICHKRIVIEDNVRIGGNVIIYDTDFHSLKAEERNKNPEETKNIKRSSVYIGQNAFIGSHSIILKGVHIGRNSIIGAGSVVSTDVPDNQIWGGNPARFIRDLI